MANKVAVFGASSLGAELVDSNPNFQIEFFVDSDPSKQNSFFKGYSVRHPDSLLNSDIDYVLIASSFHKEISVQLEMMGVFNYEVYSKEDFSVFLLFKQYSLYFLLNFISFILFFIKRRVRSKSNRPLHIIPKSGFSDQFYSYFSDSEDFIIWDKGEQCKSGIFFNQKNSFIINSPEKPILPSLGYFRLMWRLANYDKIIVHAYRKFLVTSIGLAVYRTKIAWVAWGPGDLYASEHSKSLFNRVWKLSKSQFKHVFVFTKYDMVTLRNRYKYRSSSSIEVYFNPLSSALKKYPKLEEKITHKQLKVMIGHAAYPHLEHKKILCEFPRNVNADILLPLSYGSEQYQKDIFAWLSKFEFSCGEVRVLKKYMTPDEYLDNVIDIDVFILHSNVQVGLSTLYLMLYLGKSVYLKKEGTVTWNHLVENLGFFCFDYNEVFEGGSLSTLSLNQKAHNKELARQYFDEDMIYKKWKREIEKI